MFKDWLVDTVSSTSIRRAFRVAILILVVLASLTMNIISFTNVTSTEYNRAEASVRSEVNYLCLQLESLEERAAAFERVLDLADADRGQLQRSDSNDYHLLSDPIGDLLDGYTMAETGTVAIIVDDKVIATDDVRLTVGEDIRSLVGEATYDAMAESLKTGEMQKITCEGVLTPAAGANAGSGEREGYLLAGQQDDRTVLIIETSDMVFRDRRAAVGREILITLVLIMIVFAIVERLLDAMVTTRIDKTNEALGRITAGNLDVRVPNAGTREFRSLASGINMTVDALQGWIAEAETRMDAELATARAIQASALPSTFPPFPDLLRFDIYALMHPAREVGGDFYDFFLLGEGCTNESGKLAFVVADVSGKGVPAALFMMRAKALIRDYVSSGLELGEAMAEANRQLCDGNDAGMFVTAWVGVLDYVTGHVDYVNAGHNPPLLWSRKDGWQWMRKRSGPMLGLFELPYHAHSIECQPGDSFLLYTDGVTEAFDVNENLYGEERLLAVAQAGCQLHPRELLESVRADVADYARGAEQSDDITILTLEVGVPPEVTATHEVDAQISELDGVIEFLHAELDRRLCPKRVQNQLDIVVEELFVNVCSYAYDGSGGPGHVRIQRTYSADPLSITVDIIDDGVAFNPLEKPDAVTPRNIADVPIGGLGVLMARKLVDDMSYERQDHTNVVTIVKRW